MPARAQTVADSLRDLYYDVAPAGDFFVVDQGTWKALFDNRGRPVTPFVYKSILPGLAGDFVANTENVALLLDSTGRAKASLSATISRVDHKARQYRSDNRALFDETGNHIGYDNYEEEGYRFGRYRWSEHPRNLAGVRDTSGNIILPQIFNGKISINQKAIAAIRDDTLYAYDLSGRLRFRLPAQDFLLLGNGNVGVNLFGMWSIRDSLGHALTPFKFSMLKETFAEGILEAGLYVIDINGRELGKGNYNSVARLPGGWYSLSVSGKLGDEIRDEQFRLVFDGDAYSSAEAIGSRYLRLQRFYDDNTPLLYDKTTRSFTDRKIESWLAGNAYVLFDAATSRRSVWNGEGVLPLPAFTEIDEVENRPYYLIRNEGTASRSYLGERERPSYDWSTIREFPSVSTVAQPVGLLDSAMRLLLPVRFAEIRFINSRIIYALDTGGRKSYLFDQGGKELAVLDGIADVRWENPHIVRATAGRESMLLDSTGRVYYRGAALPTVLYPDARTDWWPAMPVPKLFMYGDSTGAMGVFQLDGGQQLLPFAYHQVVGKVPGLFSLKRGDSLYFINNNGQLLFGKRGFYGRDYFLLEGYAAVMQNEAGKWGVLDAYGRTLQPFVYDSAGQQTLPGDAAPVMYLQQGSRRALLENTGELVGSSRVDLQACKLEYSIVSPK